MVKVICNKCKAKGFKYYTHGKSKKAMKFIKHKRKCKYFKSGN